jgi:hypothetical protein
VNLAVACQAKSTMSSGLRRAGDDPVGIVRAAPWKNPARSPNNEKNAHPHDSTRSGAKYKTFDGVVLSGESL